MMHSLFSRIFLWFWAAMVLLIVTLVVVTAATRSEPVVPLLQGIVSDALGIYLRDAVRVYRSRGRSGLEAYLNRVQRTVSIRALLFDDRGMELDSAGLPSRSLQRDVRYVVERAAGAPATAFALSGRFIVAARRAFDKDERRYVMVALIPRPFLSSSGLSPRTLLLRLLALLLMTSLLCYGLARSLTSPIVRLREATRQLAAGNLQARVGPRLGRRRDELAELGRDFDRMAGRIESLLGSQRRLIGDISHELRSPLARLNVALELARRTADASTGRALDRIERETGRLDELVGQLLSLARLESADPVTEKTNLDLSALVCEVVADADFEAQGRGRSVQMVEVQPAAVSGNLALLRSAIENIVRNAVRYTAEGTAVEVVVRVDTEMAGTAAVVSVRDHGPGVSEAALENLFQPFYRVEPARDRESGGTGLGLAITRRVSELHGGTVSAANVPDGGLAVELRLPRQAPGGLPVHGRVNRSI